MRNTFQEYVVVQQRGTAQDGWFRIEFRNRLLHILRTEAEATQYATEHFRARADRGFQNLHLESAGTLGSLK